MLLGLPPKREVYHGIKLLLSATFIVMAPYKNILKKDVKVEAELK